jgi:selenocysteine-specific elongation factor
MSLAQSTIPAKAPRSVIIGTAGHIDHGKTTLIRALTGVDTDRLPEEKRRGITIDLGFASLETQTSDGSMLRLSFIDVPGHARFVRNMLAGTGGIDAVLLTISAEEGVKPQTEEHLAICELLGIRRGIVVITKTDAVDTERMHGITNEVQSVLRDSFLSAAPLIGVSAHAGTGMPQLRGELVRMAESLPQRNSDGLFRLPIDRVFVVKGFGTVVTGTLIGGTIASGESLAIEPGGRNVKVRGIQNHGRTEAYALAGSRAALNLARVEMSEVERGHTLVANTLLKAVDVIDVELVVLPGAPALKHRTRAHFHAFSSECMAIITLYDAATIEPGETKLARLRLSHPVVLLPGDRFVLRSGSPVTTIGGGRVLDAHPAMQVRKARAADWLRKLRLSSPEDAVWLRIGRKGTAGINLEQLCIESGLSEAALVRLTQRWISEGQLCRLSDGWLLTQESLAVAKEVVSRDVLRAGGKARVGIKRAELRERTQLKPNVFDFGLLQLEQECKLRIDGETVAEFDARAKSIREQQQQLLEIVRLEFERAGIVPPSTSEVATRLGIGAEEMRKLMTELLREKVLVRLGSDSLCADRKSLEALAERIRALRGREIDIAMFKQLTGVSRKYAIPLLEYLDRERVTVKRGDRRLVL